MGGQMPHSLSLTDKDIRLLESALYHWRIAAKDDYSHCRSLEKRLNRLWRKTKLKDGAKMNEAEWKRVEEKLGSAIICDRCGATLDTFNEACTADLDDACPGFNAIEKAHEK